jgi:hypothetical protein
MIKHALHFELAIDQVITRQQNPTNVDGGGLRGSVVSRLQGALGSGSLTLPITQPQGQHEKKQRSKGRPHGWGKPPRTDTQCHLNHGTGNRVRLKFCRAAHIMRIVALLFIVFILGSLASALYYLIKDKGQSDRAVKMLTIRVGLSLALFVLLMAGYYFGIVPQSGLR